jgi:hypothetical protein
MLVPVCVMGETLPVLALCADDGPAACCTDALVTQADPKSESSARSA